MVNAEASQFYASVVCCSNTALQCPQTINRPGDGYAPRGFYFEGKPGNVDLLLVGKNPGHPIGTELEGIYSDASPREIAYRAMHVAGQTFRSNLDLPPSELRSTTFHKNLLRYVSYFLDIPQAQVFLRCAYTNLVKCSTAGEQDRLPLATMRQCHMQHFVREVEFLRPRVILALGREVEAFLRRPDVAGKSQWDLVSVKHPSYYYRTDQEEDMLRKIKAQINQHLATRPEGS